MRKQAQKKTDPDRGQVQRLVDSVRVGIQQSTAHAGEVVDKIRACADRMERNPHLRLVKVPR
jgi:hypothetical protein